MVNQQVSREVVERVAVALQELREQMVFVVGAVIGFYADDPAADEARPTYDVDLSVQLAGYGARTRLQARLAELGFQPTPDSPVLCRFTVAGLTVDVMPDDDAILGFTNPWYRPGLAHAVVRELHSGLSIRLLPFPYLLATKLAAWRSRGGPDPRFSHDFEDVVYLTDNRLAFTAEVLDADPDVRAYIQQECQAIQQHPNRDEIISCHLSDRRRLPRVLAKVAAIISEGY